jgi:hypothetical protein
MRTDSNGLSAKHCDRETNGVAGVHRPMHHHFSSLGASFGTSFEFSVALLSDFCFCSVVLLCFSVSVIVRTLRFVLLRSIGVADSFIPCSGALSTKMGSCTMATKNTTFLLSICLFLSTPCRKFAQVILCHHAHPE